MSTFISTNPEVTILDTTSGAETYTLPETAPGKTYIVANSGSGANDLTVNYGANSTVINDGESVVFVFGGTDWSVLNGKFLKEEATDVAVSTQANGTLSFDFTFAKGGVFTTTTDDIRVGVDSISAADNGDGTFDLTFNFSDSSALTATTPNLTGPKGDTGDKGDMPGHEWSSYSYIINDASASPGDYFRVKDPAGNDYYYWYSDGDGTQLSFDPGDDLAENTLSGTSFTFDVRDPSTGSTEGYYMFFYDSSENSADVDPGHTGRTGIPIVTNDPTSGYEAALLIVQTLEIHFNASGSGGIQLIPISSTWGESGTPGSSYEAHITFIGTWDPAPNNIDIPNLTIYASGGNVTTSDPGLLGRSIEVALNSDTRYHLFNSIEYLVYYTTSATSSVDQLWNVLDIDTGNNEVRVEFSEDGEALGVYGATANLVVKRELRSVRFQNPDGSWADWIEIYGDNRAEVKTAADWTAENPVLPAGKIGVEIDTGFWKAGDGATNWTGLSYPANATDYYTQTYIDNNFSTTFELQNTGVLDSLYNISSFTFDDSTFDLTIAQSNGNSVIADLGHNHDADYYTKTQLYVSKILSSIYYEEFELNPGSNGLEPADVNNDPDFSTSAPLDERYYTENELQTSGGASVHWDNITNVSHSLDDSYNNGSSVTVDSGDVEWLLDDSNRKFSVQTNITTPHVSFDVVNRSTTGSIYTSTGGFIDAYASERFQAISSSVELADGTSASSIDASILIQNGEIKFGDSRGAGFNDYTLTDGSNTSFIGSATSIIGGINEAYNNVPIHNHDADYYTENEVETLTDQMCQNIATATGSSITNPFTGTTHSP